MLSPKVHKRARVPCARASARTCAEPTYVHPSLPSFLLSGEEMATEQHEQQLEHDEDEEEKVEKDTLLHDLFGSDEEGEAAERAAAATAAAAASPATVSAFVARYRGRRRGLWLLNSEVDGLVFGSRSRWYAVDEVD